MVSLEDKSNVSPLGIEPQMFLLYYLDDDDDDDSGSNSSADNDMMMHVGGTLME